MRLRSRSTLAVTGAALALAAGTGSALANGGHGPGGPGGPPGSAAVATFLGLTQAELRAQLQSGKTLAQVAKAQARPSPGSKTAAATYLGLTQAELRAQIASGKSLAQIAKDKGKSVDGLKAAILAGATTRLDADVKAGRITAAQEQTRLDELKSHLDEIVNRTGPPQRP